MMGVGGVGRVGENATAKVLSEEGEASALVALFEEISAAEKWQPGGELRAYVDRSVYIGGYSAGELGGGLQVVRPDAAGLLPCHKVWPEYPRQDRQDIAHVVILAVRPEFRGRAGLMWPVCVELWRWCMAEGVTEVTLEATGPTMQVYCKLGFPLKAVGELRQHWGEPCYLASLSIAQVSRAILALGAKSDRYKGIVDLGLRSVGIEPGGCKDGALPG